MIRKLWPLLIGFTIWSLAFLTLYSVQALGCVWGWPGQWHRLLLVAIASATLLVLVAMLLWQVRIGPKRFSAAAMMLTAAATAASALTFAPVLFVTICQ